MSTSIFEPVRKLLEQAFKDAWGARTPVKYENIAFTQPPNAAFVAAYLRWGDGGQVSLGPAGRRMERHTGALLVQIFVPENSGRGALEGHCDFAAGALRMRTFTDSTAGVEVLLRSPSSSDAGLRDTLLQKNVSFPFQADALF